MSASKVDVAKVFQIYMLLVGDVDKTAVACDVDPKVVTKLAKDFDWPEKVARLSLVSKGGNPGDWERTQNRAINYVQAFILRRVIDAQLVELANIPAADLMKVVDSDGNLRYSAKVLTDLAATMQKVHEMTYSALGDSVKERTVEGPKDSASQQGIHASVIATLNKVGEPAATLPQTLSDGVNALVVQMRDKLPPGSEVIDVSEDVSQA